MAPLMGGTLLSRAGRSVARTDHGQAHDRPAGADVEELVADRLLVDDEDDVVELEALHAMDVLTQDRHRLTVLPAHEPQSADQPIAHRTRERGDQDRLGGMVTSLEHVERLAHRITDRITLGFVELDEAEIPDSGPPTGASAPPNRCRSIVAI